MENKARIFISCGQQKNSEEEKIAVGLKEEITKYILCDLLILLYLLL